MLIDQDVAIKIEKANKCNTLLIEDAIYNDLHHNGPKGEDSGELVLGIPEVFWFRANYPLWNMIPYHILVMENLGPDLGQLFHQHGKPFSTKTVLMIAEQFLDRIEYVHERGYIHRDIKPENVLMGLGDWKNTLYLADFGLAKKNDEVYNEKPSFTGTPRYASINTHLGISQSRRDDMESIGYVLVLFQIGFLPWQNIKKDEKILKMKKRTIVENLCRGCHIEFHMYLNYVRSLRFDEKPDYDYLRKLFNKLYYKLGYKKYDWKFDWTTK